MATLALVGCAHIHTPGFIKDIQKRDDVKVKSVWDHDAGRAKNAPMSYRPPSSTTSPKFTQTPPSTASSSAPKPTATKSS